MSQPPRILCLGGGWVALYLSRSLRRAVRRGDVRLTVVSRENYHTFHGFIPEMLAGRVQPQQLVSPGRRIFRPARFHNAEIREIDPDRRRVVTSRAIDGREYVLEYDHAVIAIGGTDDLSRFPGIAEHTLRVKTYWDAVKTRSHILSMLEMAGYEDDPVERRRLLTFVVVGGGFSGVEVAAELTDYLSVLVSREFTSIEAGECRVVLVHGENEILPELVGPAPGLVTWARAYLRDRGVEFRLDTFLTAATAEEAILNETERIPTRTILGCSGASFSPLLDQLPAERTSRGRLVVDDTGRIVGSETLWAAGDCAAMPHPRGGTCPMVASYAIWGGKHLGRNLLRHLRGRQLRPFRFRGIGEGASVGHRRAVVHIRGMELRGVAAWIVWRAIFLGFVPTWDRKLRILVDWTVTAIFGRDIANIRMNEPYGLREEMYEPGQAVVREGDVGRRLFIISEGEVDVVRAGDDGSEERLATLGPGQHFGEMAVFGRTRRSATVRARTRVRLLSLGEAEALNLSRTMETFGERVRRLPGQERADRGQAG